jgi:oxygen-independent coproporphyrinogen-3 oxidase
LIDAFVESLIKEIKLRKNFFSSDKIIETIYFGGGTPSVLKSEHLTSIINNLYETYKISDNVEISFEVNPDDVTEQYVEELAKTPVNRISMGVQSFDNKALSFFKRRHSAQQAIQAVYILKSYGFDNISLDLIFGIPDIDMHSFKHSLNQIVDLNVQHISIYDLIYENGTPLHKMHVKNEVDKISEDLNTEQYFYLVDFLKYYGFDQYEISNFSKSGRQSKHNSSYWDIDKPYLGLGPAAHSYDVDHRYWNVADIKKYIDSIKASNLEIETEKIDQETKYEEYVLTSLRTTSGINLDYVKHNFSSEKLNHTHKIIEQLQSKYTEICQLKNGKFSLNSEGLFLSDKVIVEFFES